MVDYYNGFSVDMLHHQLIRYFLPEVSSNENTPIKIYRSVCFTDEYDRDYFG